MDSKGEITGINITDSCLLLPYWEAIKTAWALFPYCDDMKIDMRLVYIMYIADGKKFEKL